jgi:Zn-finger nucleic acid-binding protein
MKCPNCKDAILVMSQRQGVEQAYPQSYPQGYKRKSWLEDIFD